MHAILLVDRLYKIGLKCNWYVLMKLISHGAEAHSVSKLQKEMTKTKRNKLKGQLVARSPTAANHRTDRGVLVLPVTARHEETYLN